VDPDSERGVDCPGGLPPASDPDLVARAQAAKDALGDRVFVLGHHYQRDEVIAFADVTGDSYKLAKDAAARSGRITFWFGEVKMSADSAMKCTPQKTMNSASGRAAASLASLYESPVTSANAITSSRW